MDSSASDNSSPRRLPAMGGGDPTEGRYPIDALIARLEAGDRHLQIVGTGGGLRACTLADLSRRLERPLVVLTPTIKQAETLATDLDLFGLALPEDGDDAVFEPAAGATASGPAALRDEVLQFPEFDVGPFHAATIDRRLSIERMTTLFRLTQPERPRFVVTSVRAAMRRTMPPETLGRYVRRFAIEDVLTNKELRDYLSSCGYSEVPVVEDPGTFAIRGDIVDVFSPLEANPFRIERWGDEIAEIRLFDPVSQRSLEGRDECTLFPVRQDILDDETVVIATTRVRQVAQKVGLPSSRLREILSDLQAGVRFIGLESLMPALHRQMGSLLDYVPEDALVVVLEPDNLVEQAAELWDKRHREHEAHIADGEPLFDLDEYYVAPREVVDFVGARRQRLELRRVVTTMSAEQRAELELAPGDDDAPLVLPAAGEEATFEFRARENTDIIMLRKQHQGVEQTVRALAESLARWRERYGRIVFACRTSGQVERLVQLLSSAGADALVLPTPVDVSEPVPPPAEFIEIYQADLSAGFRSELLSLCVISGNEVFGDRVVTHVKKDIVEHAAISHFRDLEEGDAVVHVDFGIGRYRGLVRIEVQGVENDMLHIEYADGDKLYVPVYRLGRVQKYIGATEGLRLDKLGGTRWEKTKERVKENIREVAGELLALYARREMAPGISFTPPDDFYREFEGAFPFEETPDQASAIDDVLGDMTRRRPMDRLVCGDVGFGKTEVAIRAAMKAVMDGKQVAVLVPTTLLAEQHLLSFRKRMAQFGARVESLSRFRSTKQTRQIIAETGEGKVDVLIGTHRLLSKDVAFRELGLLIIDEEQRFGVTHKERIKQLRANIDVLTLTATPIPRTLQMSLLGIRDLSIIATPPHSRLEVRTHVAKFSDSIVREAVMLELSRGGQVFFVHNRVATIGEMERHLRQLVPEARIAVAHGQMPENKLEEAMLSYIQGEVNVLLASSIIESGLDIPNANTIIVNRADMFGLSQLYQLRGRVGRGKERAYCYLLIPNNRTLPADAEKRLEVIQTHTELGSGFHVASYDLEIRGAGNILSEDQSGHVTAVGLDLYSELLEEAINDIRGQEIETELEPEVNIPVEAYIPDEYIPATSLRLMFYKRFSLARTHDELFDIYGEMTDRFGQPDPSVRNLRDLVGVKITLRQLRARRLDAGLSAISIELDPTTRLDPSRVVDLVHESRGRWRLTSDMKLIYALKIDESTRPLETSREVLETLAALARD